MARRRGRARTTRRRRKQGISILGVAETVALSNVATQTLFNTNAWEFLTATHTTAGTYSRANVITLKELMNPEQLTGYTSSQNPQTGRIQTTGTYASTYSIVQENLKENWMNGAISMVTIPLAFKFGKALARPAISKVNRLLTKAGVSSTVKV
jgi:hypothetical protein